MRHVIIFIAVIAVSCTGKVIKPDLEGKGVYGARIVIQDDYNYRKNLPFALYFKKLDSANNLKDGRIIKSDTFDENGNIIINSEPGIYTIIAASISWEEGRVLVVFDETIMNKMKIELKAGDTKIADTLNVMFYNGYILGKTSTVQEYNRDAIAKDLVFMMYDYRPGYLDPLAYRDDGSQKGKDVDKQTIEKYE